jgi:copper chaperone CopZ
MACDKCSARLRDGLRKLDGVLDVEADHQKKEVAVRYDPARVSPDRIKQEIRRYGFDASG